MCSKIKPEVVWIWFSFYLSPQNSEELSRGLDEWFQFWPLFKLTLLCQGPYKVVVILHLYRNIGFIYHGIKFHHFVKLTKASFTYIH